jgi:hypothetical protein
MPSPTRRPLRGLSLSLALVTSWSSLALAAPGVIKYDAEARSAPFGVAPVVEVVPAHTKVSTDDRPDHGWWRIQLPNGKFAFVRAEDIDVDLSQVKAAPPAPAPAPLPAAAEAALPAAGAPSAAPVEPLATPRAAGGRAPIYVGDFSHLAELVKTDPKAFDLASTYATEQQVSSVSIWGGVFGGLLLWVLADTAFGHKQCVASTCVTTTNDTVHNVGSVMLILGPLIGWAVRPTRDDQTNVINEWNRRHPDRPFVDRAGVEAPQ